eukprot:TRINITY_DN58236_c0_g1_i2.p1 TRINITY_DN58236_c0_g1~~TRINITY_DN58236_c0_g1_i2.p1  ORF type:complete len:465 (-),score=104.02 TRINITY_DN58236_c0_g1_i2:142-1536(-)
MVLDGAPPPPPPLPGGAFFDYYALLDVRQDASLQDLKKAYFEKVREYHPDKRPNSTEGRGQRLTQVLNEAWDILQEPEKRAAYDSVWKRQKKPNSTSPSPPCAKPSSPPAPAAAPQPPRGTAPQPPRGTAPARTPDICRQEGNAIYSEAKEAANDAGSENIAQAAAAAQKYKAAIERYSEGLELNADDHRLHCNRALCYAALCMWARCREDAYRCTQLKQDHLKGWYLYAKALWMEGSTGAAKSRLEDAFKLFPDDAQLLSLQTQIKEDVKLPDLGRSRSRSRSISPCITPTMRTSSAPRVAAPPPIHRPQPPPPAAPQRRGSRSPGPGQRHASRSPGAAARAEASAGMEDTAQFGGQTADFGMRGPPGFSGRDVFGGGVAGGAAVNEHTFGSSGSAGTPQSAAWDRSVGGSSSVSSRLPPVPMPPRREASPFGVPPPPGPPPSGTHGRQSSRSPGPAGGGGRC